MLPECSILALNETVQHIYVQLSQRALSINVYIEYVSYKNTNWIEFRCKKVLEYLVATLLGENKPI